MSWKTDGNPKSSTDGNKVTCQPKSGDVSNAVWTPGMTTGQKKYWKVIITFYLIEFLDLNFFLNY